MCIYCDVNADTCDGEKARKIIDDITQACDFVKKGYLDLKYLRTKPHKNIKEMERLNLYSKKLAKLLLDDVL